MPMSDVVRALFSSRRAPQTASAAPRDEVAAAMNQGSAEADALESLPHRRVPLRQRLGYLRDALRMKRGGVTRNTVSAGVPSVPVIPVAQRCSSEQSRLFQQTIFGSDADALDDFIYNTMQGSTVGGESVFLDRDFHYIKSIIAPHWTPNTFLKMQLKVIPLAFNAAMVEDVLRNSSLQQSLAHAGRLAKAAADNWSPAFLRVRTGMVSHADNSPRADFPESFVQGFVELWQIKPERIETFKSHLQTYLPSAEHQALLHFATQPKGQLWASGARCLCTYTRDNPALLDGICKNVQRVGLAMACSPTFRQAYEVRATARGIQQIIQAHSSQQAADVESDFAPTVDLLEKTLNACRKHAWFTPELIASADPQLLASLPGLAVLQGLMTNSALPDAFIIDQTRGPLAKLEALLPKEPAQREACLVMCCGLYEAEQIAELHLADIVGLARQVGYALLTQERQKLTSLLAAAYARYNRDEAAS